jgi:glutathionyl-hydroquinone reductase
LPLTPLLLLLLGAGKYSVPVLWDKQEGVIVNNESSDILRMFNASFNNLAKNPELDLYPEHLRAKIDEVGVPHWQCVCLCYRLVLPVYTAVAASTQC